MSEELPPTPQPPLDPTAPPEIAADTGANQTGLTFNIGDEFGTAKRNLPPVTIVLIGIAVVLVAAAVLILTQHRPSGVGSIYDVSAVEIPGQNAVLVAINVNLQNSSKKAIQIHTIKASIVMLEKKRDDQAKPPADVDTDVPYEDEAASPMDFERYFQAFPALRHHAVDPLKVETRIPPGGQTAGTIVVSFPVTEAAFNQRKSLNVTIQPYDEMAIVLTGDKALGSGH